MRNNLAIIIPAYKEVFLEKVLISLENQTNKNFNVYVGDDNSPYDLESICKRHESKLNLQYIKFINNIGAKNLVDQWIRCIELSKVEDWIWVFSDDDLIDSNCVEVFYFTINSDKCKYDVYRFDTRVIDDTDLVLSESTESPFVDTSENMAYCILMFERGHSMPDHIFSRSIYDKYGFVKTDYAQAADWATFIRLSKDKGICTMKEAKISWRLGCYNISGNVKRNVAKTIKGHFQFLNWIIDFFKYMKIENNDDRVSYEDILRATEFNLEAVIKHHYLKLPLVNLLDVFRFYNEKEAKIIISVTKSIKLYYKVYFKWSL
ncbi:glycosyl transferase family 2 [Paludibacter propionicigenes WB4]|uniref:Glycosyl transferase family 2 n=1 Tax=Paludibacter propionicigenes (strain DSM 17365 / JCM 13257 / WB4) TaxID=694427 RepID=E4T3J6_PALPW|nr:glycosyltransferase [Paludibacter propionicigenes]ADQ79290.1 glycosyl transferase family 2 [Paludibacter propionicigenes WB4]